MLFPYQYFPHQIEKMQAFIDFIFHEVWCKAPTSGAYSLELFRGNVELYDLMVAFHYSDTNGAEFFGGHVQAIYGQFALLDPNAIQQLQHWYNGNNNIEQICANNPAVPLARYSDIAALSPELANKLATFYKRLYDKSLLELADLENVIGTVDSHYKTFTSINKSGKCPFCGINDIMGPYHSHREAYDHYLPKKYYPFNSINFRNLVPACHQCNSSYKTIKDPAYTPKDPAGSLKRRKVFYPFATDSYAITVSVILNTKDMTKLTPDQVDISFGPPTLASEITAWQEIYGINERYQIKLSDESDGKYWLFQVMDEWKQDGRKPSDFIKAITRQAADKPFAGCNFLKKPFLDACNNIGLFNP